LYLRGKFEVLEEQKILPPYLGEELIILMIVFFAIGSNYLNKSAIFSNKTVGKKELKNQAGLLKIQKICLLKLPMHFLTL